MFYKGEWKTCVDQAELVVQTSEGPSLRSIDYGSSCSAWDKDSTPFCDAPSVEPAEHCENQWCYVDPLNCEGVRLHRSYYIPGDVFYSYDTCGSSDKFVDFHTRRKLEGQVVRFAYPKNHDFHDKSSGQWTGLMHEWLLELQKEAKFILEERSVSNISLDLFPSAWDACTHDVKMGLIDVCPASAWETETRREMAQFASPVMSSNMRLLLRKQEVIKANPRAVFEPIQPLLWLVIVGMTTLFGVIFWYIEGDRELHGALQSATLDLSPRSPKTLSSSQKVIAGMLPRANRSMVMKQKNVWTAAWNVGLSLIRSIWLSWYGALVQDVLVESRTPPGRLLKLSKGFFVLVFISTYTANLAASFVQQDIEQAGFTTLDEFTVADQTVCVHNVKEAVQSMYPSLRLVHIPSSAAVLCAAGIFTQWQDEEKCKDMETEDWTTGMCDAALVPDHDYYTVKSWQNCSYTLVGDTVMTVYVGTPVSERIADAWSYYTVKLHYRGVFERLFKKHTKRVADMQLQCPTGTVHVGVGVTHMAAFLLGILGMMVISVLWKVALDCRGVQYRFDEDPRNDVVLRELGYIRKELSSASFGDADAKLDTGEQGRSGPTPQVVPVVTC
jgi:hypothetical protein